MLKEQLQKRIAQLNIEKSNMAAMYDGAIQDCQHWLGQLDVKDTTEQSSKPAE